MPVRLSHNIESPANEIRRNPLVKHVAHRIDEYRLWFLPSERKLQCSLMKRKSETVRIVWLAHSLQSHRHPFGVAMLTTRANFRAASKRVPG